MMEVKSVLSEVLKETQMEAETISEEKMEVVDPIALMEALGVQRFDEGKDGCYQVGFQGGRFLFSFTDNLILNVYYYDFTSFNFTESTQASVIANDVNQEYTLWKCYLRVSGIDNDEEPVKACLSQFFNLYGSLETLVDLINAVLPYAFEISREFMDRCEKQMTGQPMTDEEPTINDFTNKLELMKRMMDSGVLDAMTENQLPDEVPLTVDFLLDALHPTELGLPLSMNIVALDEMESIAVPDQVMHFNCTEYIRNHPKRATLDFVTFILHFEKQDLVIHLRKASGSTEKSLFYLMNMLRSGDDADRISDLPTGLGFRTTIEIRLTTEQEDYWEVKYMIDEAKSQYEKVSLPGLTEEQRKVLAYAKPSVSSCIYWGMKFYNQDCMLQSLYHFRFVYERLLRMNPKTDEIMDNLACASFYIGAVYMKLKAFDRAYYYLEKGKRLSSAVPTELFVHCLCALNDSNKVRTIQDFIHVVEKCLDDDDADDKFLKFYLFLRKRLVKALVMDEQLDEAEEELLDMIENEEEVDFAEEELAILQSMKGENTDGSER